MNRHRDSWSHFFGGDGIFRPWHPTNVVQPRLLTIPFLGAKNRLSGKFDSHRVQAVVQKFAAPRGFASLLAEALAEQKADIMYRVDRNNFYQNEKKATVCTPDYVSEFLFSIISPHIKKGGLIVDPCVGEGALLLPWQREGYKTLGIDIEDQGFPNTIEKNYLEVRKSHIRQKPSLVIMNPPFNIDSKTKEYIKANYGGRPLLPEVWFQKALELFGTAVPIAMFTPYGFRLNQTDNSSRWKKFIDGEYPEITSIVSLPKDVFDGILFHSEVLIFNLSGLNGHYFVQHGKQRAA